MIWLTKLIEDLQRLIWCCGLSKETEAYLVVVGHPGKYQCFWDVGRGCAVLNVYR